VTKGISFATVGLLLAAWFWFGWAPLKGAAVMSGSDYQGLSVLSFLFVFIGLCVAAYGIVMAARIYRAGSKS
jgi:hypothetical protein